MGSMIRAVFLDALGTLVRLEPPWSALSALLGETLLEQRAKQAFLVEMAYYREHHLQGYDAATLLDLRRRCAAVLSDELGRELDPATMMATIRFQAYPDARPALSELRRRGTYLHCVSNWDCSLPEVLEEIELRDLLDGVSTSAVEGAAKPNPAIFAGPLAAAGCKPHEAIHVGDSAADVEGAAAAGIGSLHIDRSGNGEITSLTKIVEHLSK